MPIYSTNPNPNPNPKSNPNPNPNPNSPVIYSLILSVQTSDPMHVLGFETWNMNRHTRCHYCNLMQSLCYTQTKGIAGSKQIHQAEREEKENHIITTNLKH